MVKCPLQGKDVYPLGVFSSEGKIFLTYRDGEGKSAKVMLSESSDGRNFQNIDGFLSIRDTHSKKISLSDCSKFRFSSADGVSFLSYKSTVRNIAYSYGATSVNRLFWNRTGRIADIKEAGLLVPNFKSSGKYVYYFGEDNIGIAFSANLKIWEIGSKKLLSNEEDFYGRVKNEVAYVSLMDDSILLLYYSISHGAGFSNYSINSVIFDKDKPEKILRKTSSPIWSTPQEWAGKKFEPIGIVWFGRGFLSYWASENEGIYIIDHNMVTGKIQARKIIQTNVLKKSPKNPIIVPRAENFWESKAVFNPAAVYDEGKVHLVYRAIGDNDVSVLGYASSSDGVHFDQRNDDPVYLPTQDFESSSPYMHKAPNDVRSYASGGSAYGGCEDPRITKIDGKYYMTYVAYNGWAPPRVALTSIKREDFLKGKWDWKTPVLISKPGVVDKNACILPEKINGKYVVFHRIFPNILVDFVDNLDFDGDTYLKGEFRIEPDYSSWDSRKVGVGAPPMKTEDGWLVIYHSVGERDAGRYKMGAMVLDHENPTKVLYRTKYPILEPREWYENEGFKAGVAYPCGAVIMKDNLNIYYGGADSYICVAQANIHEFLKHVKAGSSVDLLSVVSN